MTATRDGSTPRGERTPLRPEAFAEAIDASPTGMVLTDARRPDNPIVHANPAFHALTGYGAEECFGRNCRFMQGPATDRAAVARLRAAIAEARPIALELLNYRRDGTAFWNLLTVTPVRNAAGELIHFFATQSDVTSRRGTEPQPAGLQAVLAERSRELDAAHAERARLIHELDHRVKNNIQLLIALVGIEVRRASGLEARGVLARVRGRMETLAAVHRSPYDPTGAAGFDLTRFLADIADALPPATLPACELTISGGRAEVPPDKAAAVGLLLYELLSELMAGHRTGSSARIDIKTHGDGREAAVDLAARGLTLDADAGEAFVATLLARQLRASTERLIGQESTVVRLRVPLRPAEGFGEGTS